MHFNWWKAESLFFFLQVSFARNIYLQDQVGIEYGIHRGKPSALDSLFLILLSALSIGAESKKGVFKEQGIRRMGAG